MKMTRRQLAAVVSATAISAASAQTEQRAATPSDDLAAARDRLKANSAVLDRLQVPMAVEPAFQFKS
jgi:hypothetical protein